MDAANCGSKLNQCSKCKEIGIIVEEYSNGMSRYEVVCEKCYFSTRWCLTKKEAIEIWNTRAPILSSREMEMLNGKENP